jgi:hypothetical protein
VLERRNASSPTPFWGMAAIRAEVGSLAGRRRASCVAAHEAHPAFPFMGASLCLTADPVVIAVEAVQEQGPGGELEAWALNATRPC